MVASLEGAGEELLTFYAFPPSQWLSLRTTNAVERLPLEFRRRVKTQGGLPGETAALCLLFGLLASGQIRLRRIKGFRDLEQNTKRGKPTKWLLKRKDSHDFSEKMRYTLFYSIRDTTQ